MRATARCPFPFEELDAPPFEIRLDWRLEQLVGYVGTWSAVWDSRGRRKGRALSQRSDASCERVGPATAVRAVRWPWRSASVAYDATFPFS